jgi:hypothetical protein
LPEPAAPVIVAPDQLPSTTLEALSPATGPEEKLPALAMNVPPRDDCAAAGVSAPELRFLPQMMIVRVLPATADLFGDGHALPGAGAEAATTASRTSNECTVTPREPGASAVARFALRPLVFFDFFPFGGLDSNWCWLPTVTGQMPVTSCGPLRVVALTLKFALRPGRMSSPAVLALSNVHLSADRRARQPAGPPKQRVIVHWFDGRRICKEPSRTVPVFLTVKVKTVPAVSFRYWMCGLMDAVAPNDVRAPADDAPPTTARATTTSGITRQRALLPEFWVLQTTLMPRSPSAPLRREAQLLHGNLVHAPAVV